MPRFFSEYEGFWTRRNKNSFFVGMLFLAASLYVQALANRYSARSATNFVGDLLLDNLPTVNNLDYVIVDAALAAIIIGVVALLMNPRHLLFAMKAAPTFMIVRSFFVTLTHVGIYPEQIVLGSGAVDRIYSLLGLQGGFFFSGHTGMPILMALILWPHKGWRFFFLGISVLLGAAVLLAHVHYSIDVFAAPFITYGVFRACQKLFPADYRLAGETRPR